jgi:hypothetical protein
MIVLLSSCVLGESKTGIDKLNDVSSTPSNKSGDIMKENIYQDAYQVLNVNSLSNVQSNSVSVLEVVYQSINQYKIDSVDVSRLVFDDFNGDSINDLFIVYSREASNSKDREYSVLLMYIEKDVLKETPALNIGRMKSPLNVSMGEIMKKGQKNILVKEKAEYPRYAFIVIEENNIKKIDLTTIGFNNDLQDIDLYHDEGVQGIYTARRVDTGLWGVDYYKLNNNRFEKIKHGQLDRY